MAWAVLLLCALAAGCAQATIRKVPNRADYEQWTDAEQKHADSMCGLRVYGSRPYVVVHQSFPLPPSKSYLVDGVVSADGKFVKLDPVASRLGTRACAELAADLHHFSSGEMYELPLTALWKSQGSTATKGGAPKAEGGTITAPALLDAPVHAKAEDRPTGTATLALQTELEAWATKKLGERFEVVYLPDFEEQYVIDPQANLGSARVSVTQGPGGQMLAMGMQVDNSAVTRPLVDAYTKAVEAVGTRLTSVLGTDPADSVVTPKAEGADVGEVKEVSGHPITVRVHVLTMASPGVYPVLKASEVVDSRNCLRELTRCLKCKGDRVPCSNCRDRWANCSDPGCSGCPDICMLPCGYPGSRIAYQTFRTILVEHLISSPAAAKLVGLAEGGAARKAEVKKLFPNTQAVRLALGKGWNIQCVQLEDVTEILPVEGGVVAADITKIVLTLDHEGFHGPPPPETANSCTAIVDDYVRKMFPGLKPGTEGLVVNWSSE
jgi:hypothetical protein